MKRWTVALLLLAGCQAGPAPTAATATPAAPPLVAEDQGWFTYFAPDGSFSLQFPKAPEDRGSAQTQLKVHGLDKSGSNLTLVQTPLPPSFSAENVTKDPEKFFAKPGLKIVKSGTGEWNGHKGIKLEMEAGGNRIWVHMIFAKPWLYQLVALQSSQSSEDFGPQRNQFFGSFQFTRKK